MVKASDTLEPMTTDPLVTVAKADSFALEREGKWAALYLSPDAVRLVYGAILSDGTREEAIATRHYYLNDDKDVVYWTQVHP